MRAASIIIATIGLLPYLAAGALLFSADVGLVAVLGMAGAVLVLVRPGIAGPLMVLSGMLGYMTRESFDIPGQPEMWPLLIFLAGALALVEWVREVR